MAKKKSRKKATARSMSAKTAAHKSGKKSTVKRKHKKAAKEGARPKARKCATKKSPKARRLTTKGRRIVETRTWRRIGRLAGDAVAAIEADNIKDAKRIILSIEAVAICADEA